MSRHGTLLPLIITESDRRFEFFIEQWPDPWAMLPHPRSAWLYQFEGVLKEYYPQSSSADRKLTARHYAPFPLAQGPNVP
jgi:hypothetical protein